MGSGIFSFSQTRIMEIEIRNAGIDRRLQWRCRRGLLELDIVLDRFVKTHYAGLDGSQRVAFEALLDMPDTLLWDMIAGRVPSRQQELDAVLAMINAA